MTETPVTSAPPRRPRRMGTALDMLRSLALVGLGVALVAVFMMWKQPGESLYQVDVATKLADARSQADYPVLALGADVTGWTANTVVFRAVDTEPGASEWRIGYLNDGNTYLAVNASDVRDGEAFLRGIARFTEPTGQTFVIDGREWTVYDARTTVDGPARALWVTSATEPEPYVIAVSGTAPASAFEAFVRALRAD